MVTGDDETVTGVTNSYNNKIQNSEFINAKDRRTQKNNQKETRGGLMVACLRIGFNA